MILKKIVLYNMEQLQLFYYPNSSENIPNKN